MTDSNDLHKLHLPNLNLEFELKQIFVLSVTSYLKIS